MVPMPSCTTSKATGSRKPSATSVSTSTRGTGTRHRGDADHQRAVSVFTGPNLPQVLVFAWLGFIGCYLLYWAFVTDIAPPITAATPC
jgi:hypothetical protein